MVDCAFRIERGVALNHGQTLLCYECYQPCPTVKIFASDRKLPIPVISGQMTARTFTGGTRSLTRVDQVRKELTTQPAINGLDLVDFYKGIALAKKAPLYEATVFVETKPQ